MIERQIDSPLPIPPGMIVKKAEKLSNRDANLAIAKKRFGRSRLRWWWRCDWSWFSGVQSLNFIYRTPTRAKLITGGPPPARPVGRSWRRPPPPGAFVVAQVVGPMANCHRPIFRPLAGRGLLLAFPGWPQRCIGSRATGRHGAHGHNDAPALLVRQGVSSCPSCDSGRARKSWLRACLRMSPEGWVIDQETAPDPAEADAAIPRYIRPR